jgi:hypothetical protein
MKPRILSTLLAFGAVFSVVLASSASLAQTTQPAPAPARPGAKPQAPPTAAPPAAPADNHLGDAEGWSAFADPDKSGKICYVVGRPVKSEPRTAKRGDVYVYVTHRSAEHSYNVVSFNAGYPYKDGSDVELAVDAQKFELFTSKDTAWARDSDTEKAIVEAMMKGRQAVIKGTSARGTVTIDTYALAGFSQVLGLIDKACGLKR